MFFAMFRETATLIIQVNITCSGYMQSFLREDESISSCTIGFFWDRPDLTECGGSKVMAGLGVCNVKGKSTILALGV